MQHPFEMMHVRRTTHVLIFQRIRKAGLRLRKEHRLLFYGKLKVLGILMMGVAGYWLLGKYSDIIEKELLKIVELSGIRLGETTFKIVEWTSKRGHLALYVVSEARHNNQELRDSYNRAYRWVQSRVAKVHQMFAANVMLKIYLKVHMLLTKVDTGQIL